MHTKNANNLIAFVNCHEEMATGMRILATIAKENGFDVHIIVVRPYETGVVNKLDIDTENAHVLVNGNFRCSINADVPFSPKELTLFSQRLVELDPKLICVSTRSRNDSIIPPLLRAAKSSCPSSPLICGGYGPSYAPKLYLESGADLVVCGEGELAFAEILRLHKCGQPLFSAPNVCWLDHEKNLQRNPLAPPLRDITNVPVPLVGDDYVSFIANEKMEKRDPAFDNKMFFVLSGRGCIGNCSYCAAPVLGNYYKNQGFILPKYRRRHHDQVLQEIKQAKEHGATKIYFKDEYLVDDPLKLVNFFTRYAEIIDLPFRAHFHPEQLLHHPDLRRAALKAGLYGFTIGFQAGSEDVAINKYQRPHRFADLLKLTGLLFPEFISLQFHFVSGTSINTKDEFEAKCRLISQLPFDPAAPWRSLLMDFQFFPQPLSALSHDVAKGTLFRLPRGEWARNAFLAQLRHIATTEEIDAITDSYAKQPDPIAALQNAEKQLRLKRKQEHYKKLARQLAGKDIFVMGEATPDYAAAHKLFEQSRIAGYLAFPGAKRDFQRGNRITPEELCRDKKSSMPVLMFGESFPRFSRVLRQKYAIAHPLYGVRT